MRVWYRIPDRMWCQGLFKEYHTVFGNPVYNMLLIGSIFCKEKRIESHTQAAKDRLKNLFFCRVFINRETVLCNLNFFIELESFL